VIDRAYALEDAAEAHAYVDTGRKRGSVVLRIGAVGDLPVGAAVGARALAGAQRAGGAVTAG
jgi:hypothetical protein